MTLIRPALILLSIGLLWPCVPSGPVKWLPFLAMAPFALTLKKVTPITGFLTGWFFGSLIWVLSIWSLANGFETMLDWDRAPALALLLFYCLFQGLPYALLGMVSGWMERRGRPAGPLFSASLLTLLIYLRPAVIPGSPAVTLYSWAPAIQIADLGGVHLVLFVLLLSNWLIADAITCYRRTYQALARLSLLAIMLICVFGYGNWRIHHFQELGRNASQHEFLTVASVQPNIPIKGFQGLDTKGPYVGATGAMVRITEKIAETPEKTDLILWPEVPCTVACNCDDFRLAGVQRVSACAGAPIMVSCVEHDYGKNLPVTRTRVDKHGLRASLTTRRVAAMYNSVWLVDPDQCKKAHRKIKLVPFGERTPFQEYWPWLKKQIGRQLEYSPGRTPSLITLERGGRVQPLICYEGGYPELTRQGMAMGADMFVNVADDAWFGATRASELHLGVTLFRSVEFRRPLVRCTNSGFGAHVTATGAIVPGSLTPADERTYRRFRMHCPRGEKSPYSHIGDIWLWLLCLFTVICMARVQLGPLSLQKQPGPGLD